MSCQGDRACVFPVVRNGMCYFHYRSNPQAESLEPYKDAPPRIAALSSISDTVLIHGTEFRAKDKAPFIRSGKSVLGAIEYDAQSDTIKCHQCGEWFTWLPTHLERAHGMSGRDYRIRHGLSCNTALCTPSHQKLLRRAAKKSGNLVKLKGKRAVRIAAMALKKRMVSRLNPVISQETRNLRRICLAQLLARIAEMATSCGHTPTVAEMGKQGIHAAVLRHAFGSVSQAMIQAGLTPNISGRNVSGKHPQPN